MNPHDRHVNEIVDCIRRLAGHAATMTIAGPQKRTMALAITEAGKLADLTYEYKERFG